MDRVRPAKEIAVLRGHVQFSTMISNSSDAIVVVAEDGIIGYVSPVLESSWGWESGSPDGEPFATLLAPASRLSAATWLHEAATASHPAHLDAEWVGSDGVARPVSMVISDLRHDADIGGFVVTGRDVSYRVELEHQMRHEAQHVTLTQLWNRSTMVRHLQDGPSRGIATGHTMLFIDLDDFKDVNDASDAARVVDLVVDALAEPMEVGGHSLTISASIGWCTPNGGRDAKSVIRNADLAMFAAKRDGKARSVGFRNDLLVQAEQRLDLRRGLSTAIADGELHPVYQPLISVSDGWTTGYEALLRWTPSGRDPLTPDDFISIAEETGAIIPIGEWVLEQACLAGMALSDTPAGDLPVISVNVSPVQLRHDFKAVVARVLAKTGLPSCTRLRRPTSWLPRFCSPLRSHWRPWIGQ